MAGRPLLYYTLETLDAVPWLQAIVVPVAPDRVAELQTLADGPWHLRKVRFVEGGATRHRSIWAGLKALEQPPGTTAAVGDAAVPPDVVIVHDAVRPFVDSDTVRRVALAAHAHGAGECLLRVLLRLRTRPSVPPSPFLAPGVRGRLLLLSQFHRCDPFDVLLPSTAKFPDAGSPTCWLHCVARQLCGAGRRCVFGLQLAVSSPWCPP